MSVNKKETGRELDGKEWLEYPKASARLSNAEASQPESTT